MTLRHLFMAGAVASLGVARADAAVIDFEAFPVGLFASHTEQGVTFTASGGGGLISRTGTPNGTQGLLETHSPRLELRADIAGGASFVAVDLGDFNADPDTIFLEIFNAGNVSLGFASLLIDAASADMWTLSLSAPDIAYAIFGARAPALNGSSVFADNFTWTPEDTGSAVPEPGSLSLLALGLAATARRLRRR